MQGPRPGGCAALLGGEQRVIDRRVRILERIDVANQRGLELGPLHHPIVDRDGTQVLYVDHADTATLRQKYEGHDVGAIVDVDVVWDQRLAAALGERGPVAYVVASHVIEHVPDLVGWLAEVAEVLAVGGVLSLAIPDKRFCFDRRRAETQLADVSVEHLQARQRPSARQVFDFWSGLHEIDTAAAWAGTLDDDTPLGQDELALQKMSEAGASTDYVDVHCWVFTPRFVPRRGRRPADGLGHRTGLRPFWRRSTPPSRARWSSTPRWSACPTSSRSRSADAARRRRWPRPEPRSTPPVRPHGAYVLLSASEHRAVELKRATMERSPRRCRPGARRLPGVGSGQALTFGPWRRGADRPALLVSLGRLIALPRADLGERGGRGDVGDRPRGVVGEHARGRLPAGRPDRQPLGQEGHEDLGLLVAVAREVAQPGEQLVARGRRPSQTSVASPP